MKRRPRALRPSGSVALACAVCLLWGDGRPRRADTIADGLAVCLDHLSYVTHAIPVAPPPIEEPV